jgi:hypothetical protein
MKISQKYKGYTIYLLLFLIFTLGNRAISQQNCNTAISLFPSSSLMTTVWVDGSSPNSWFTFNAGSKEIFVDLVLPNDSTSARIQHITLLDGTCGFQTEIQMHSFIGDSMKCTFIDLAVNHKYFLKVFADFDSSGIENQKMFSICLHNYDDSFSDQVIGSCTIDYCGSRNLINNGNFDNPGVPPSVLPGFYSDYYFREAGVPTFATYPDAIYIYNMCFNPSWNTSIQGLPGLTGNTNFLIVDGYDTTPGIKRVIWGQLIDSIIPGAYYNFSMWLCNLNHYGPDGNLPNVRLDINNIPVSFSNVNNEVVIVNDSNGWIQVCGKWFSGSSDTARFEIFMESDSTYYGNDLGIDKIEFFKKDLWVEGFDRTICLGDIVNIGDTLTIHGGIPSYSFLWSNNINVQANTVSPSQSTVYSITVVDHQNCITSDDIIVTVAEEEPPKIIGNNNNCNLITSYFVANSSVGDSLIWEIHPGNSGYFVSNQDTVLKTVQTSTSIQWKSSVLFPTIPDRAWLCVTWKRDGLYCVKKDSIPIFACCYPQDITDSLSNDTINTITIFNPGSRIAINGKLVVNDFLYLDGCNLFMGPESEIIMQGTSGNLLQAYNSSFIAGCDYMWNGITVQDSILKVVLDYCIIKDAICGIQSENGGRLEIHNSSFLNNSIGIRIKSRFDITGKEKFKSDNWVIWGNIFSNSNSNAELSLSPYQGNNSFAGIVIDHIDSIFIGDANNAANTFSNTVYGIKAKQASLSCFNNLFSDHVFSYTYVTGMNEYIKEGVALESYGSGYSLPRPRLRVGGDIPNQSNNFFRCLKGVVSFQQQTTILKDTFVDCVNPVTVLELLRNEPVEIADNIIMSSNSSVELTGTGVYVGNASISPTGVNMVIENNEISNLRVGISLVNQMGIYNNNARILFNSINLKYSPVSNGLHRTGINIQGSDFAYIYANTVNNGVYSPTVDDTSKCRGLRIAHTKNALIKLNQFNHLGSGIFTNGLLTNTNFVCNTLSNCYHGFYFGVKTALSNQGSQSQNDPTWIPHNNFIGPYLISNHQFKLSTSIGNIISIDTIKWYFRNTEGYNLQLDANCNNMLTHPCAQNIKGYINNNSSTFCNFSPGPLPNDDSLYFSRILDTTTREERLGRLLREDNLYIQLQDQYYWYEKEYLLNLILYDTSLINLGGFNDITYRELVDYLKTIDIGRIAEIYKLININRLDSANYLKEFLNDNIPWVKNYKDVFDVYLRSWATNSKEISENDQNLLLPIALLTPYEGGPAVYSARVLLGIDPEDFGIPYHSIDFTDKRNDLQISAFPNPANQYVTISTNVDYTENSKIEIFGLLGNSICVFYTNKPSCVFQISLNDIPSGIYTCRVSDYKRMSQAIRIIVVKN